MRNGQLVPLTDQDRAAWNSVLIDEATTWSATASRSTEPGATQTLSAINAVHTDGPTTADTEWSQVTASFDARNATCRSAAFGPGG